MAEIDKLRMPHFEGQVASLRRGDELRVRAPQHPVVQRALPPTHDLPSCLRIIGQACTRIERQSTCAVQAARGRKPEVEA